MLRKGATGSKKSSGKVRKRMTACGAGARKSAEREIVV